MFKWIQAGWAQIAPKWIQSDPVEQAPLETHIDVGANQNFRRQLDAEHRQREIARKRRRIHAEDEEAFALIMACLEIS